MINHNNLLSMDPHLMYSVNKAEDYHYFNTLYWLRCNARLHQMFRYSERVVIMMTIKSSPAMILKPYLNSPFWPTFISVVFCYNIYLMVISILTKFGGHWPLQMFCIRPMGYSCHSYVGSASALPDVENAKRKFGVEGGVR